MVSFILGHCFSLQDPPLDKALVVFGDIPSNLHVSYVSSPLDMIYHLNNLDDKFFVSMFSFVNKYLEPNGCMVFFHEDSPRVAKNIKSFLEKLQLQDSLLLVHCQQFATFQLKIYQKEGNLLHRLISLVLFTLLFTIHHSQVLSFLQTTFSRTIMFVREQMELKFQPQVKISLDKGLQFGEDDLLCNLSILETMDMSILGIPFKNLQIQLLILQHLIQGCSLIGNVVVNIMASTSMLGLFCVDLKFVNNFFFKLLNCVDYRVGNFIQACNNFG